MVATSSKPANVAQSCGVLPSVSGLFTVAPALINISQHSKLPENAAAWSAVRPHPRLEGAVQSMTAPSNKSFLVALTSPRQHESNKFSLGDNTILLIMAVISFRSRTASISSEVGVGLLCALPIKNVWRGLVCVGDGLIGTGRCRIRLVWRKNKNESLLFSIVDFCRYK